MARVTSPPLSAGRTLGDKYEIVDVIGEGGTGIVYDAVRLPDREKVALKVMHAHLAGDNQIRGRFTREAAILRRLDGANLCPILDFGEMPDPKQEGVKLLYIALPKLEGPDLDRFLKKDGPITIARAVEIMLQIVDALKHAHGQGIIHRDLKPANVLLRNDQEVVVVDFGMAKIVTGGGTGTTNLTTHNMVFGTPEYMSPEQARGDELDARCDIYAAGVMLYEMLTGVVPFGGSTPLNVLTAHLTSDPTPPRQKAPGRAISPALEAVVMHAIAKDPDQRYVSAEAFGAAILHACARPDDAEAVHPDRFKTRESIADAYAQTMPLIDAKSIRTPPPAKSIRTSDSPATSAPPELPAPAQQRDVASRGWLIVWVVALVVALVVGVGLSLMSSGR
jgi:serine/threonine-protein kinase